ncbi:MAG: hypothetical protein JWR09_4237 [Mucilaginibacter sp.]|nr:hypothetical protein [Mucilaginibacter sp.]
MLIFPYYLYAEWVCFISALLYLKSSDSTFGITVKLYLLSVVALESVCRYVYKSDNNWLYNLDMPIEFTFGIWIVSKVVFLKRKKIIMQLCLGLFFSVYLLSWILKGNNSEFFKIAGLLGSVIIICLCIYYYFTLFHKEEYVNLLTDPAFLFISGYFLFYTTSIGLVIYADQLDKLMITIQVPLSYLLNDIINLIFYGFWVASIICLYNKKTSLLQL